MERLTTPAFLPILIVMKRLLLLSLISFTLLAHAEEYGVEGQVESVAACSKEVMVWISLDKEDYRERLLLMHTLVPVGGKFQFYLKPGNYQLRATDDKGCGFFRKISVKDMLNIQVKMEQ